MKYDVTIKEACTSGFWTCLEPMDVVQLISITISFISVLIALYAGRASWKSANASKEAAMIAEKQLKITNEQRIDSVRPELFIKNGIYTLRYYKEICIGLFTKNIVNLRSNEVDTNLYLSINNIGEGHAKNIQIKWDFDLSECINFIKEHQTKDNQYIINYEAGSRVDFPESSTIFLANEFTGSEPIFITNKDYSIRLPYSYTRILSIYIHILNTKHDFNFTSESLPKLNFSITYNDVLKNPTIKGFTITPQITQKGGSTEDGEIASYELEVLLKIDEIS